MLYALSRLNTPTDPTVHGLDVDACLSSAGPGCLKDEAEAVLSAALLAGRLPPKAKFRADDEISIGDPGTESILFVLCSVLSLA